MGVMDLLAWMLDTDPSLRWQVQRDLADEPEAVWQATRALVPQVGFGRMLLDRQDPDGQWAGGSFFPAGFFDLTDEQRGPGQPWTATTWALNDLRLWGVDASAMGDTMQKVGANSTWEYNDGPYWEGEVDVCINSWTLSSGAWLGADVSTMVRWFGEHQMADGCWNCEWEEGSTRGSFHSTLNALRAILYYEQVTGDTSLREARHRGEEYLLERRLLYRLSTGELVGDFVTRFTYPFRSYYKALTAVDYFRDVALHDGTAPDARLADAVDLIRRNRQPDGTWLQQPRHPGAQWFEVDVPPGEPSPWLTFYGTRVLDWWEKSSSRKNLA